MSAALPSVLRARFQKYIEEGLSGRAAATRLKVSAATGVRWQRKLHDTGSVAPDIQGRPLGCGKLAAHRAFPEELVVQDGDITLPALAGALEAATGVVAHSASIGRFLRKPGCTYKKSHRSQPSGCARVKNLRQDKFRHRIPAMRAHPDRLVFIPSHRCKQRLPGSGRNICQNKPHPLARSQLARPAPGNECALRRMGHSDVHGGPDTRQSDRAMGD